jgi:hypothetical protein
VARCERHAVYGDIKRNSNVGALARMSQSGRKTRQSSALLQHENSNDIALNCATTKRHTVVCRLYGARDCLS